MLRFFSALLKRQPRRGRHAGQRGTSDLDTVFFIVVGVVVLSVGYIILEWVKGVKDGRVRRSIETHNKKFEKPVEVKRAPKNYTVRY